MKKIKKKNKAVTKKVYKKKVHQYEAHYLAFVLIAFLLIEGFLFTNTGTRDWQKGISVLDVSAPVMQTVADVSTLMQPVSDAVVGVNEFYQVSATAMIELLDMSEDGPISEISFVTNSVNNFYQEASIEMASLLDMSEVSSWPAQVAGVSVTVQR